MALDTHRHHAAVNPVTVSVFTLPGAVHKVEISTYANESTLFGTARRTPVSTLKLSLPEAEALLDSLQAAITTVRERTNTTKEN
jgi:hypothetical protein